MPKLPIRLPIKVKCLECEYCAPTEQFEVLGACEGCIFCPRCGCEIDSVTGLEHEDCEECGILAESNMDKKAREYVEYCVAMEG